MPGKTRRILIRSNMDTKALQAAARAQLEQIAGLNTKSIPSRAWHRLIDTIDETGAESDRNATTYYLLMTTIGALGLPNPQPEDMPTRWAETPLGKIFLTRWLIDYQDGYCTPSDAAKRAGATMQNIRQWANFGRIATIQHPDPAPGRATYMINIKSLEAFLSERGDGAIDNA